MTYSAAAIGPFGSIYGFSAAGADIYAADTPAQALEAFKKVLNGGYGVVFITETFSDNEEIRSLMTSPLPAVLVIPDTSGSLGKGAKELHGMVEKAAGADILG